jgi:rsbT co-antagonist protein RsbR
MSLQEEKLMADTVSCVHAILKKYRSEIQTDWMDELTRGLKNDRRISEAELATQTREFLTLVGAALSSDGTLKSEPWTPVRDFLDGISRSRAQQGFTSDETATFIFSLKKPLFERLRKELGENARELGDETWNVSHLLDQLGLHTIQIYQKAREAVISRQQEELLELSTPVVKLWDGILALPMIGTLDSARTQVVMESLLQRIVETGSEIAIVDITGVPTVDTVTAQHLLKTVTAIRMMGADCIISGIRPQIAQTIVHLGIDLQGVTTKATLADALALALKRTGFVVSRTKG